MAREGAFQSTLDRLNMAEGLSLIMRTLAPYFSDEPTAPS